MSQNDMGPGTPRRVQAEWAKEMVLEELDKALDEHPDNCTWEADDHAALMMQRNRVAKLFKLPVRTGSFFRSKNHN